MGSSSGRTLSLVLSLSLSLGAGTHPSTTDMPGASAQGGPDTYFTPLGSAVESYSYPHPVQPSSILIVIAVGAGLLSRALKKRKSGGMS